MLISYDRPGHARRACLPQPIVNDGKSIFSTQDDLVLFIMRFNKLGKGGDETFPQVACLRTISPEIRGAVFGCQSQYFMRVFI
ncbi:hypothetical protein D3C86_1951900 [compost metagenome]